MTQLSSAVTYQSKQHKKNHHGAKVLPEVAILSFYWRQTLKIFGMVFLINNVFLEKLKKKVLRSEEKLQKSLSFFLLLPLS